MTKAQARKEAEVVFEGSMESVQRSICSGHALLSKIVAAKLEYKGYYACKMDGVKVYFGLV